ncbi:MAG TPA: sigma-70 family RNA polymerase sigma factor, partial [Planctomycetes bacterium]|nr:sigma-70 family RNA polymerase sigma factor [Planctomycetota bacterium]
MSRGRRRSVRARTRPPRVGVPSASRRPRCGRRWRSRGAATSRPGVREPRAILPGPRAQRGPVPWIPARWAALLGSPGPAPMNGRGPLRSLHRQGGKHWHLPSRCEDRDGSTWIRSQADPRDPANGGGARSSRAFPGGFRVFLQRSGLERQGLLWMKDAAWNARLGPEGLVADMAWLRRLARGLVGDADGGDDLAQEAWVTLIEKRRRPEALRPYLAGIVRRLLLERRRGEGRRLDHEDAWRRDREEACEPTPGKSLERIELQELVLDAMRVLPEAQRDVLVLRYLDDLTPAQIAERRGVPAATVRSQLSRGLAALRERLDAKAPGGREAWLSALLPFLPAPSVTAGTTGVTTIGIGALAMKTLLSASVVLLSVLALRSALHEPSKAELQPRSRFLARGSEGSESGGGSDPLAREMRNVALSTAD